MARNILLILASLVISPVLGEALVRVVHPQQLVVLRPDIWQPVEGFGWRHRELVDTVVNTGEGLVHFRTDEVGRRINFMAPSHNGEHVVRILVLGDSFLEALQVENEETTAELLRGRLEERYGKPVKVDNTAVAGWDPNHYLLQAKTSLTKNRYDFGIVFLYIGNDIVGSKRESFRPREADSHPWRLPSTLTRSEIIDAVLYPFNEMMERTSHLYVFLKNASQQLLARLGLTAYYFPDVFLKSEAGAERWRITAEVCADIKTEFEKFLVPVVFVLLPDSSQVHREFFDRYVGFFDIDPESVDLEQPNRLLSQEFVKKGLRLIDVLPDLRRGAKAGGRMYGWIDDHFNRYGHQAVAEVIEPVIGEYVPRP